MQAYCGTDIIEIRRIKKSIDEYGSSFLNRVFTQNEIDYCESKKDMKYQHYAARFSAKEAVFKAVSKMLENKFDLNWKNIEVINDNMGRPCINFVDITINGVSNIDISISHCEDFAIAMAVVTV